MANIISMICVMISVVSLVFFLIGLISGKMIGVEMIAVVQISFFSLMSLTDINPCFAALASLKYVNGYNNLGGDIINDSFTPGQIRGISLYSNFTSNFNFTAAIIVIPLIVSLISLILWKTAFKDS